MSINRGDAGIENGAPSACLAHSDTGPCKIFPKTLIVLNQSPELELGHRLFVRSRAHCGLRRGKERLRERGSRKHVAPESLPEKSEIEELENIIK